MSLCMEIGRDKAHSTNMSGGVGNCDVVMREMRRIAVGSVGRKVKVYKMGKETDWNLG